MWRFFNQVSTVHKINSFFFYKIHNNLYIFVYVVLHITKQNCEEYFQTHKQVNSFQIHIVEKSNKLLIKCPPKDGTWDFYYLEWILYLLTIVISFIQTGDIVQLEDRCHKFTIKYNKLHKYTCNGYEILHKLSKYVSGTMLQEYNSIYYTYSL